MNKINHEHIMVTLKNQKGFNFMEFQTSILKQRIRSSVPETNNRNCEVYQEYLEKNPDEIYRLIFLQLI